MVGSLRRSAWVAANVGPLSGATVALRQVTRFGRQRKKLCPECAERVRGAAQVCRYCGHRFTTPGASSTGSGEPMGEPLQAEGRGRRQDRSKRGRNDVRITVLIFLGIAATLIHVPSLVGPVLFLLVLVVVAVIRLAVKAVLKRPTRFRAELLGFATSAIAFFVVVVSVLGATHQQMERDAAVGNSRGTPAEQDKAHDDLRAWLAALERLNPTHTAALRAHSDFLNSFEDKGATAATRRAGIKARDLYARLGSLADTELPASNPELQRLTARYSGAAALAERAHETYLGGLRNEDQAALEQGDEQMQRAQRAFRAVGVSGRELFDRLATE